jgi:hypothetical protein
MVPFGITLLPPKFPCEKYSRAIIQSLWWADMKYVIGFGYRIELVYAGRSIHRFYVSNSHNFVSCTYTLLSSWCWHYKLYPRHRAAKHETCGGGGHCWKWKVITSGYLYSSVYIFWASRVQFFVSVYLSGVSWEVALQSVKRLHNHFSLL